MSKKERTGHLWAITSYFNPVGYRRRLANYRVFRERLQVPLVAVELAYGERFELQAGDADILIQLRGRDVMWQKERLLNVALGALPDHCTKVAWLDCDVFFEREDWVLEAERLLDEFAVLQLFRERHELPPDGQGVSPSLSVHSFVRDLALGEVESEDFFRHGGPLVRSGSIGLAWAGRREILGKHGLYDACVMGSGDRVMLNAFFGKFDHGVKSLGLNRDQERHYRSWAEPIYTAVGGNVGYLDARIYHLWHGEVRHRNYEGRYAGLAPFQFDPARDIALDENRCWRWNSDKPDLHRYVCEYFESRKEDG